MEGISSTCARRMQHHAGYAFIEIVAELVMTGCRALAGRFAAFAEARRRAQARHELQRLSDHALRDIGLDRGDIESLFR
jgi:uncharacterized protein YjiS (DUF1127 family)